MILKTGFISVILVLSTVLAQAQVHDLKNALSQATSDELKDLPKLLSQLRTAPTNEPSVRKVTEVEKGSLYDRLGIKVGDLVSTGKVPPSKKAMKLDRKINR